MSLRSLLLFLVMATVGWLSGGNSGKPAIPDAQPETSRSVRPERVLPGRLGETAKRLAPIHAAGSPEDKMRATIELANSLPVSDIAAWLEGGWFNLREGMNFTLFTNILTERWQNEDPEGLILWAIEQHSDSADSLRSAWAESDPERLLALFKERRNDDEEIEMLVEIAGFHPDLALRRFQEMIDSGLAVPASELMEQLAKTSPAALEAILDSLPSGVRFDAERFLIAGKMRTSFTSELHKLWDRPDGLVLLDYILSLDDPEESDFGSFSSKLLAELANFPDSWRRSLVNSGGYFINRTSALQWLSADLEGHGFGAEEALKIRIVALDSMVYRDPEETLKRMASLNIPTDDREPLIKRAFRDAARIGTEEAQSLFALLTTDEDRETARQITAPPVSIPFGPKIEIDTPAKWLAAMEGRSEHEKRNWSLSRMWTPEDLSVLKRQFNTLPVERKLNLAPKMLDSASPLRAEATAFLIRQPWDAKQIQETYSFQQPQKASSEDLKVEIASDYIVSLAEDNPESAGQWITQLPDGQPKLWAAKHLHILWADYDPAAADRWMKSLPTTMQNQVKLLGTK
jgi:hypothetical protein